MFTRTQFYMLVQMDGCNDILSSCHRSLDEGTVASGPPLLNAAHCWSRGLLLIALDRVPSGLLVQPPGMTSQLTCVSQT